MRQNFRSFFTLCVWYWNVSCKILASFKQFISLTEKCQLTLVQLTVTTMRTERRSCGVGGQGIDMSKVREIMSTLPQPVPSNVQELMTSVEQYQKVNLWSKLWREGPGGRRTIRRTKTRPEFFYIKFYIIDVMHMMSFWIGRPELEVKWGLLMCAAYMPWT